METLKVFLVLGGDSDDLMRSMFEHEGWTIVDDILQADLVQFGGGDDVNPELYNEHRHEYTYFNSQRDKHEIGVYDLAQELGIPCAGICRGGQFLHVMNGGSLWQDVDCHGQPHKVKTPYSYEITVSSTHHQMMRVENNPTTEKIVLLRAQESRVYEAMSNRKLNPYIIRSRLVKNNWSDVEAIYYPATGSLCYQPHPEYIGEYNEVNRKLYFHFLKNYPLNPGYPENDLNWEDVE